VAEATAALEEFMVRGKFGDSSARVVIEQCLKGQEATVMAIVDGDSVLPLVISQDYKRLLDGDRGPNTGGMGAISPTPVLSEARLPELVKDIFHPVLRELQAQGIRYRGFLYAGVMVDDQGTVNVIEFNCRLGDPETEVLMMRLESDLLAAIDGAVSGRLESVKLEWSKDPAVCVVIAASGYPDAPEKGREIAGLFPPESRLAVFHSGTAKDSAGRVVTNGGRVLAVTALGANFNAALREAYRGVEQICFSGMHFRRDIGSGVKEG
jgi:phosphoribosylamine--glycine ligase